MLRPAGALAGQRGIVSEQRYLMLDMQLFCLPEEIQLRDFLLATYYMKLSRDTDVMGKATKFAVGQTVGTWVKIPGITNEMQERYMGRVIRILDCPPCELSTQRKEDEISYFIQLAFPSENIGEGLPGLLTMLLAMTPSPPARLNWLTCNSRTVCWIPFAVPSSV